MYEYLSWDSEFFGYSIGRVDVSRLNGEGAAAEVRQAAAEPIDCLYILVSAQGRNAIQVAEEVGARLVDVRVTLTLALDERLQTVSRDSVHVRASVPTDIPALMDIARSSHSDSRFYADPRLPNDRCDALYARWIEKRCEEEPEAVLVGEFGGDPVGYLSLRELGDSAGLIDLVAVASEARGEGVGMQLTTASLRRLREAGCGVARVVTQGGNRPALRLYGSVGFVTDSVDLWYHYWPDEAQRSGGRHR